MTQPVWLLKGVVLAVHDMQLAEHGGPAGVRDDALPEPALARPNDLHASGDRDLCRLAATYTFGIIRNHPFVDGDKRTGFLAAYIFLKINGLELIVGEVEATSAALGLASGNTDEKAFAAWLRANVRAA